MWNPEEQQCSLTHEQATPHISTVGEVATGLKNDTPKDDSIPCCWNPPWTVMGHAENAFWGWECRASNTHQQNHFLVHFCMLMPPNGVPRDSWGLGSSWRGWDQVGVELWKKAMKGQTHPRERARIGQGKLVDLPVTGPARATWARVKALHSSALSQPPPQPRRGIHEASRKKNYGSHSHSGCLAKGKPEVLWGNAYRQRGKI